MNPAVMRWVRQEDPDGCGVAVLAMLTGQTFAEVDATVKRDYDDHTVKPHEMSNYLWNRGYFLRRIILRKFAPDGAWPPRAFAPLHYLNVQSPTGTAGHWVAMDGDGLVLDPWDPERNGKTSAFYKVAYEAVGVIPPYATDAVRLLFDRAIEKAAERARVPWPHQRKPERHSATPRSPA